MRVLKDKDLKLFEQIASLKQPVLLKTMYSYLKKLYKEVVYTRDYVYAIGDIPVALVAHLDTVFSIPPENIYYDTRKGVVWSPEGLGADDRAGVYMIIKILRAGYRPHIIFTTDEEKGGLGAMALTSAMKEPFADMKYLIQLDRAGTNDCVFYDCDNPKFTKYVESFGFIESIGSFSDISELCPIWGVAGVNLSVGYENEHSVSETLHVNPMLATIEKVKHMLDAAKSLKEKFDFIPCEWYKSFYGLNSYLSYPSDTFSLCGETVDEMFEDMDYEVICKKCGKRLAFYECIPVLKQDKNMDYYCPDCVVDEIQWCDDCGEAFEPEPGKEVVIGQCFCPNCVEIKKQGVKDICKSVISNNKSKK